MASEIKTNLILALSTITFLLAVLVGAFEIFESYRYERWKSYYQGHGDWQGRLTIPSLNKVLMWEYKRNAEFVDPHLGYSIRTNRHGFRDHDYTTRKEQPHCLRIAFIGDSVTLGLKVDVENTFVRKFEMSANKESKYLRVQALNFGIDGYNTIQIEELLRTKVLEFETDKVVYVMCMNDFDFEDASGEKMLYFRKPESFFLLKIEKLWRVISRRNFHLFHFKKNKDVVFQKVTQMRDLLEQRGIEFRVILIPAFESLDKKFDNYSLMKMHKEIRLRLSERNIVCLDLLKEFSRQSKLQRFYAHDIWHPNEEGHSLIAQQLMHSFLVGQDKRVITFK